MARFTANCQLARKAISVLQRGAQQRDQLHPLGRGGHLRFGGQGQLAAAEQAGQEGGEVEAGEHERPQERAFRRAAQGQGGGQAGDQADDGGVDGPLGEDLPHPLLGGQVPHPGVPGAAAEGGGPAIEDLGRHQAGQGRLAAAGQGQQGHADQGAATDQAGQHRDPLAGPQPLDQQHPGQLQQLYPEGHRRQQADRGVGGAQLQGEGGQDDAAGHRRDGVRESRLPDQMSQAALAVGVAQAGRGGKKHALRGLCMAPPRQV
ncbi:MAG: hypothetical protein JF570_13590 [Caulobacter sp.]|nr:hypothetical protein [Caulobacter sp.]